MGLLPTPDEFTDCQCRQCYNGSPHGGGLGGLMLDPIDSCNDFLFFLHHAYLDKLCKCFCDKSLGLNE